MAEAVGMALARAKAAVAASRKRIQRAEAAAAQGRVRVERGLALLARSYKILRELSTTAER
jgi:hypothetical protein